MNWIQEQLYHKEDSKTRVCYLMVSSSKVFLGEISGSHGGVYEGDLSSGLLRRAI
jgi:hypothetical protein